MYIQDGGVPYPERDIGRLHAMEVSAVCDQSLMACQGGGKEVRLGP